MERSPVDSSHFRHCLRFCCGENISVDGLEEGHAARKEEDVRAIRNGLCSRKRMLYSIRGREDSSQSRRSVGHLLARYGKYNGATLRGSWP